MRSKQDVIVGLRHCLTYAVGCEGCPYSSNDCGQEDCGDSLYTDVMAYMNEASVATPDSASGLPIRTIFIGADGSTSVTIYKEPVAVVNADLGEEAQHG